MSKYISLNDKFLVAGATGMAGSSILRNLKLNHYGLNKYNGEIFCPSRKELDLLNQKNVNEWFSYNKPTVVILAAAKVGGIMANYKNPADFILENLKIQNNIIEASWRFGIKRFLFLGSSCIYPKFANQPLIEEYLLTGELEKTNDSYAIAKIAGIKLCDALRRQYGFDAISLMPTNLYGTNDNYTNNESHVFASLIRKFCEAKEYSFKKVTCWGTGSPMREFMHVDDLGRAVVFALEKWNPSDKSAPLDKYGNPLTFLNVGTEREISIHELALKISKETKYQGEIIWDTEMPDGTPRKKLSIEKISSLGWKPTIDLDEGIKQTVLEFKSKFLSKN